MFVPADRPRVAVASDGSLAAFVVVRTVTIVELASGTPIAELEGDLSARAIEVGWLDAALLVLTRHDDHSVAQVFAPWANRVISELRLDSRLRLLATAGPHALVGGARGGALLSGGDGLARIDLPIDLPIGQPVAAGAAAHDFVIATDTEIVRWDPRHGRASGRWPLASGVTQLGGHEGVVWMISTQHPARIDVVRPGAGRPFAIELPGPIVRVADHPAGDSLACLDERGRLTLVDLVEHARPRALEVAAFDRIEAVAVLGRGRLLVARGSRPISIVDLGGREVAAASWWDARWREDVVAWSRTVVSGAYRSPAPAALPIDVLLRRLAVPGQLRAAVVLLYGAHLGGSHGVAPSDVAKVAEGARAEGGCAQGAWDEALGRGLLVRTRVVRLVDSRVHLADAIVRALAELPPHTGTLVGEVAVRALAGPCVVVASEEEPLPAVAERCVAALGGAILAAHVHADFAELVFEARVRGASAMVRLAAGHEVSAEPVVYVCADEQRAGELGIPRIPD